MGRKASDGEQRRPGEDPARKAKAECLRLLAVKPRTRAELAKALGRKGYPPDIGEPVLDRLEKAGLIDDTDYADILVRSKYTNLGLGRRALRTELRKQGIDDLTAELAVAAIGDDAEEARARELVRKRLPSLGRVDNHAAMRRLTAFLERKGYPGGLAYRIAHEELQAVDRGEGIPEDGPPEDDADF